MSESLSAEPDPDVWVLLDPADDPDQDEAWALQRAAELFEDTGQQASDGDVSALATVLLAQVVWARTRPAIVYAHLPDPWGSPTPLVEVTALSGSDLDLRELAGAEDPDLLEPPVVTEEVTPLGPALRCYRFVQQSPPPSADLPPAPAPVVAVLTWVWHVPEADAVVRVACASEDLGELAAAAPDVDALARTVRVG